MCNYGILRLNYFLPDNHGSGIYEFGNDLQSQKPWGHQHKDCADECAPNGGEPHPDTVRITALKGGDISIERHFTIREGDTVNLVITKFDSHVKIVEKKGVVGAGADTEHLGLAMVSCIGQRWYSYRYESEVTGKWCAFEFTNVAGNNKEVEMRL